MDDYRTQERCASYLEQASCKNSVRIATQAMEFHENMIRWYTINGDYENTEWHEKRWQWWDNYRKKRASLITPWWKKLLRPIGLVFGYMSKGSDFYLPL